MPDRSAEPLPEDLVIDDELDVTGLNCPLPILKTRARLKDLADGAILRITATDPLAPIDFRAYCARNAHELLSIDSNDERSVFVIRKQGG